MDPTEMNYMNPQIYMMASLNLNFQFEKIIFRPNKHWQSVYSRCVIFA